MATYSELRDLFNDDTLRNRVEVAIIVSAQGLADNANNNAWLSDAYSNPRGEAEKVLMSVLAEYKDLTVSAITSSTDANLQTAVDGAVARLVKAKAGV